MKSDQNLYSALKSFSLKTNNSIGSGCSIGLVRQPSLMENADNVTWYTKLIRNFVWLLEKANLEIFFTAVKND